MNDAPLMTAYAELRSLVEAEHVPIVVKAAALRLSEFQTKLFTTVFVEDSAAGTILIEPSNRLLELIKTLRARDWPRFIVLIHSLDPPSRKGAEVAP